MRDIECILLEHNPIQLNINNKVVWDDEYDDLEAYGKIISENSDKIISELWINTVEHHHSLVKLTTWENNNGT
jgi:hypothetical protein